MRKNRSVVMILALSMFALAAGGPLLAQETAADKLVGSWNVEILVDTEAYYLTMSLALTEGLLSGTVSEPSGTFSDVPLNEVAFDGTTLAFGFSAPTPPDGLERAISVELKFVDDTNLEGILNVPDLGIAAPVKAAKQ